MNRWLVRGLVTAGMAGGIWLLSAGAAHADHCGCPDAGSALPLGVVSGLLSSVTDSSIADSSDAAPAGLTAGVRVAVGIDANANANADTESGSASVEGAVKAKALVRVTSGSAPSGRSDPSGAAAASLSADVSVAPVSAELVVAASVPLVVGADIDSDTSASAGAGAGTEGGSNDLAGGASAGIDLITGLRAGFWPSIDAATTVPLAYGAAAGLARTGVTWSRSLLLGTVLLATGLLMYCAGRSPAEQT